MAAGTAQWRDRASGFFSFSSFKLKDVTQTASIFVGDVAKDAGTGVAEVAELAAEVAERASTAMRTRWALLQQARQQQSQQNLSSQESVQDRLKSAAASTSVLLKRSLLETKEKVAVGKTRVEQAAKRVAERSRSILERWQKGQANTVSTAPARVALASQDLRTYSRRTGKSSDDHSTPASTPANDPQSLTHHAQQQRQQRPSPRQRASPSPPRSRDPPAQLAFDAAGRVITPWDRKYPHGPPHPSNAPSSSRDPPHRPNPFAILGDFFEDGVLETLAAKAQAHVKKVQRQTTPAPAPVQTPLD